MTMTVAETFRNRVRVRVNGLLVRDRSILMVQLHSPVAGRHIWMPPGGGVRFGEPLLSALQREMVEETGIRVSVGPLWYLHEIIHKNVHAVEFYYLCRHEAGSLRTGTDPEYSESEQIITDAAFLPFDRLVEKDIYPAYLREGFVADYLEQEKRSFPRII
jgi:8-oxo-dGTP diphosphatase